MIPPLNLFPKHQRTYAVSVDGYGEAHYTAPSAGKARAQAYRDFCDTIARKTFHEFLAMSRVRRVTPSEGKETRRNVDHPNRNLPRSPQRLHCLPLRAGAGRDDRISTEDSLMVQRLKVILRAIALVALMFCVIGSALNGDWGNTAVTVLAAIALMLRWSAA
jgi:hypothetical protein